MKIVILAAGKGTRMGALTKDTPKPLLPYKGKTLLEHKLEILPESTTGIIIVIGYLGDKIRHALGQSYRGIPITYVEQHEMLGTAHALFACRPHLDEDMIILMGDDLYTKEDMDALAQNSDSWAVLAHQSGPNEKAGKCVIGSNGFLEEIYEDFEGTHPSPLAYTGVCRLSPEIFTKDMVALPNGEYGLPQTLSAFSRERNIRVITTADWKHMTTPEDLAS